MNGARSEDPRTKITLVLFKPIRSGCLLSLSLRHWTIFVHPAFGRNAAEWAAFMAIPFFARGH
jgi:hypothetical protein